MEFIQSLSILLKLSTLGFVALGTLGGVLIGALPGLSGPIGVALLLPFTFGLDPVSALLLLGGIYMGSCYGGSISAILLNTPGTEAAACTAIEGYPMAKQGRSKEALFYAIMSSTIGGLVGVLCLVLFTPTLARIAIKFGPAEIFFVALLGLTVVGSLTGKNLFKGLFAAALGLLISTVGPDIMSGNERLTFGISILKGGIPLIPAMIGLFAISEMLNQAGSKAGSLIDVPSKDASALKIFVSILKKPVLIVKSAIVGTIIGILPGTGGTIASFIAYGEAKRSSSNPEKFGNGHADGIIAAESANNAAVGGSLVPLLALGIPGSATAAVLYGALTIQGLIPGPNLFVHSADVVYPFMVGMFLTVLVMAYIGVAGVRFFSKVIDIKLVYIVPVVIVLCIFGAYSIRNNINDVMLAVLFGLLGLLLKKWEIPIPPIVLGIILGPLAEEGFRQSLSISRALDQNLIIFFTSRPLSVGLFVLVVLLSYFGFKGSKNIEKTNK